MLIDSDSDEDMPATPADEYKQRFPETFATLDRIEKFLLCVKCNTLPPTISVTSSARIYLLGPPSCLHKYCHKCITGSAGKPCVVCGECSYPKDVRQDLFATALLPKLYTLRNAIMEGIINMEHDDGPDNDDSVVEEVEEEGGKIHISNDEKQPTKEKGSDGRKPQKSPQKSAEEFDCSDEELFKSQDLEDEKKKIVNASDDEEAASGLPLLTPYVPQEISVGNGEQKSNNDTGESFKSISDDDDSLGFSSKPQKTSNKFFKSRNKEMKNPRSSSIPPPQLTPQNGDARDKRKPEKNEKIIHSSGDGEKKKELVKKPLPLVIEQKRRSGRKSSSDIKPTEERTMKINKSTLETSEKGSIIMSPKQKISGDVMESGDCFEFPDSLPSPQPQPVVVKTKPSINGGGKRVRKKLRIDCTDDDSIKEQAQNSSLSISVKTSDDLATKSVERKNSKKKKDKKNAKGETVLHIACKKGEVVKVKGIVTNGEVELDAADNAGWTALHEAVSGKGSPSEKYEIVKILCEAGCSVNCVGGLGEEETTALHSAVLNGLEDIVKLLVEDFGASVNIKDGCGRRADELCASGSNILHILKKAKERSWSDSSADLVVKQGSNNSNSNNDSSVGFAGSGDIAAIKAMLKRAVLFLNFDLNKLKVDPTLDLNFDEVSRILGGAKISDKLTTNVTHIVHELIGSKEDRNVKFSYEYLFGIANGVWQVGLDWIQECIKNGKGLDPAPFEINGIVEDIIGKAGSGGVVGVHGKQYPPPKKARINRDAGNPGLFQGFTFYLYKACGFSHSSPSSFSSATPTSSPMSLSMSFDMGDSIDSLHKNRKRKRNLSASEDALAQFAKNSAVRFGKRELVSLIQAAGGKVTNREPYPDLADPLEGLGLRFHAMSGNHVCGETSLPQQNSNAPNPFEMTGHIFLYDGRGDVPPKSKLYELEHVKTLKSDWVIESLVKFKLEGPECFL